MKEQKYIIYSDNSFDVFSVGENHKDVARKTGKMPIAAGFLRELDGQKWCGGESWTLKLQSRGEEDMKIILPL